MSILSVNIGNYQLWKWLLMSLYLIPMAIGDIKEKRVSLVFVGVGVISGITCLSAIENAPVYTMAGLIPGAGLMLLSLVLKGAIGPADGAVLALIGSFLGFRNSILVLFFALMLSLAVALYLILIKKAGRKKQIPFVPFLVLGFVGVGII